MYGRSPLSVVLFCDPITIQLNISLPPEHLRLYSVMTPLGKSGGPHLKMSDVELAEETENVVGDVLGPELKVILQ